MNWRLVNIFLYFLLSIVLTTSSHFVDSFQANSSTTLADLPSNQKSSENPCNQAKSITVKILTDDSWGSGILVKKQGTRYSVLTNAHLLRDNDYKIKTPDRESYKANLLKRFDNEESKGNDLAVLQFDSPKNYQSAKLLLSSSTLEKGQEVLAAGFPINPDSASTASAGGFVCKGPGKISLVLNKPMKEGYQIGYFIDIAKGMSGGPLLNAEGEVIGINGKHSDPIIFTNPDLYQYQDDGSRVNQPPKLMTGSSWAIPIETFVQKAPPSLALNLPELEEKPNSLTSSNHQGETSTPQLSSSSTANDEQLNKTPLSKTEVEEIAARFTVLVLSSSNEEIGEAKSLALNSGVIIAREGQKYSVLTNRSQASSLDQYLIWIPYGYGIENQYRVSNIIQLPKTDLAILEFNSDQNYDVAKLGKTEVLGKNGKIYVSGWGNLNNKLQFIFSDGEITNSEISKDNKLTYTNKTTAGMIGGPILEQNGFLVGIHLDKERGILVDSLLKIAPLNLQRQLTPSATSTTIP